ncbi:hypothetical protein RN001_004904 [Aquatica leii]|uniref:NADH dehydrogenase [ubiquinone] 1 beta subcomplex subunit 8, mitochondrial n=1 Tax=Aquatica leii TaxID=1421715 RepID=A0AAN7Q679_9COLE|nr:hypothetical protein RN001_004904 [Aquatica leii]
MALARSTVVFSLLRKKHPLVFTAVRNHWNKDYKPGPYPKTADEHITAAKKYGLLPSEYQVYIDNGDGCGDYPKLPVQSADARDPFYPWDIPDSKRNFNETIQAEEDMYAEHRYDISMRHRVPLKVQLAQFLGFLGTLFVMYMICEKIVWFHAVAEKQYPKAGVKHYSFDLGY